MAKKPEKPFAKIQTTRAKLDMYVEFGDLALDGQSPQDFAAEVREAFAYLIDFRNIINGMVSLDEAPAEAVLPYLPMNLIREAAENIDD